MIHPAFRTIFTFIVCLAAFLAVTFGYHYGSISLAEAVSAILRAVLYTVLYFIPTLLGRRQRLLTKLFIANIVFGLAIPVWIGLVFWALSPRGRIADVDSDKAKSAKSSSSLFWRPVAVAALVVVVAGIAGSLVGGRIAVEYYNSWRTRFELQSFEYSIYIHASFLAIGIALFLIGRILQRLGVLSVPGHLKLNAGGICIGILASLFVTVMKVAAFQQEDIVKAKIFCEELILIVDKAKAETGYYPETLPQVAKPFPVFINSDEFYQLSVDNYYFYVGRPGAGRYLKWGSDNRKWQECSERFCY